MNQISSPRELRFDSIRSDWLLANAFLPRALRQSSGTTPRYRFTHFPRHWVPFFEWFGIPWQRSKPPTEYIPFYSGASESEVIQVVRRSKKAGGLRNLVEATTIYDPLLSDCLYILDHTVADGQELLFKEHQEFSRVLTKKKALILNGWQSYGRQSILALEKRMLDVEPSQATALALPCSMKRPYFKSSTHKKIYAALENKGWNLGQLHKIVISSLGVIPEEHWLASEVVHYNSGVPDIYRVLRLIRSFFKKHPYELVLDCLQFEPYSDLLQIVRREGIINRIERLKIAKSRGFFLRP